MNYLPAIDDLAAPLWGQAEPSLQVNTFQDLNSAIEGRFLIQGSSLLTILLRKRHEEGTLACRGPVHLTPALFWCRQPAAGGWWRRSQGLVSGPALHAVVDHHPVDVATAAAHPGHGGGDQVRMAGQEGRNGRPTCSTDGQVGP